LQEENQFAAVFADVRRGKALAGAVEQATVTNASGEVLDVAALFGIEAEEEAEELAAELVAEEIAEEIVAEEIVAEEIAEEIVAEEIAEELVAEIEAEELAEEIVELEDALAEDADGVDSTEAGDNRPTTAGA
jgi:trigger factor